MAKKGFCPNTVAGSQPGQKYDEEIKTAVLCDLLTTSNIHKVARRYKIPESTIRGWLKKAKEPGENGEKSLWEQAREEAVRDISAKAAVGARLAVENIQRRLVLDEGKSEKEEQLRRQIALARSRGEEGKAEELRRKLEAVRPMGDFAVANHLRALMQVSGQADKLLGEDERAATVTVQLSEEIMELAE